MKNNPKKFTMTKRKRKQQESGGMHMGALEFQGVTPIIKLADPNTALLQYFYIKNKALLTFTLIK